ncbi:hypothetical protein EDB83DRAFT_2389756, partial [Lactarius deliciosus]
MRFGNGSTLYCLAIYLRSAPRTVTASYDDPEIRAGSIGCSSSDPCRVVQLGHTFSSMHSQLGPWRQHARDKAAPLFTQCLL